MTCVCNINSRLYLCHRIYSTATAIPLLQPSRLHKLAFSGRCRYLRYSALPTHASRPATTLSNRLVGHNCHTTVRFVSVSTCNEIERENTTMAGIPDAVRARYKAKFESDPKNRLARNVITKLSPEEALRTRESEETACHVFTHKVEAEGKPMTNQKSSGRCWIFAVLNCMRIPLMKKLNLEELQLSQNYLFFMDKLERTNYQLQVFVETARNKEPADGRLVQHLLKTPASEDGGQWDMLVGLVEKYGVMPQDCFPDTWSAQMSRKLGVLLDTKMREFCMRLRHLVEKETDDETIQKEREAMMEEIYRIISICVGTPPDTFTFEYYDKDKKYQKIGPISPIDFYTQYVKPQYNMEDKVVLVNDPRPENPFNKLYTVQYLSNMENGLVQKYINQPVDVLKKLAADSIKNNEAVWFGCDVGKFLSKGKGLLDLKQHDYDLVFGTNVLKQSKADRLVYGESLMTHAMVLTALTEEALFTYWCHVCCLIQQRAPTTNRDQGYHLPAICNQIIPPKSEEIHVTPEGKTLKWRVENSWGEDYGVKGYLVMTDDWFSEFVYEVVVDKKFVPPEILDILKEEAKMLPAWDPMGMLAK